MTDGKGGAVLGWLSSAWFVKYWQAWIDPGLQAVLLIATVAAALLTVWRWYLDIRLKQILLDQAERGRD